jgi:hypothetical protein
MASTHARIVTVPASPVSLTVTGVSPALGVPVDRHAWNTSTAATASPTITVFIDAS